MKFIISLFLALTLFANQGVGLRTIKVGDRIELTKNNQFLKIPQAKLVLFLKSSDLKSKTFFKFLSQTLKKKKIKLFLIDVNPATDKGVLSTFNALKIEKELIIDRDREIYQELGVIISPSLLYLTGDNVLNSLIAGYRSDLKIFFDSHLKSLVLGKRPGDVYRLFDQKILDRKITQKLNQAFVLLVNEEYNLANRIYAKTVKEFKTNLEAQLGYGFSLLLMGKIVEGQSFFKSLKEKNNNKRIIFALNFSKVLAGENGEAIERIVSLMRIEPRFFPISFLCGDLLAKKGRLKESVRAFKIGYKILLRLYRRKR